jgi:hypothetical protein
MMSVVYWEVDSVEEREKVKFDRNIKRDQGAVH